MRRTSPNLSVSDFVSQCRERLHRAVLTAKEALSSSQAGMKQRFDRKAVQRQFQPGDKVLVLLPTPGSALTTCFSGPCPVNMLKPFHSRTAGQEEPKAAFPVVSTASLMCVASESDGLVGPTDSKHCGRLSNSELLSKIDSHLSYLSYMKHSGVTYSV